MISDSADEVEVPHKAKASRRKGRKEKSLKDGKIRSKVSEEIKKGKEENVKKRKTIIVYR